MNALNAMKRRANAIGLDVGGTKIAGGVLAANGEVLERIRPVPSPAKDPGATIDSLCRIVADLTSQYPEVAALGVGAAGMVEWPEGRIRWAPNNAYRALPLRQLLEGITGLPTVVDNDANAAAWAEARLGGCQASYMAFVTVGTGVGGGLVIDNQLYRGKTGLGGELGHLVLDPRGDQRCGCGNLGCLEALASGVALGRYGGRAAEQDPDGMLAALARTTGRMSGETVLAAARESDPTALSLFEEIGHWLGVGIASLVNLFDFELIVVGGGVAVAAGELLLRPARTSFEQFVFASAHRELPAIVPARLAGDAGWIGAALLAMGEQGLVTAPTRSVGSHVTRTGVPAFENEARLSSREVRPAS